MNNALPILVFGASGRVGQVFCREAQARGWTVVAPQHGECDLMEPEAVCDYVLRTPACAVVNCAAISGLEECESDALSAHLVNAVSPARMALACRHTGARFIHLSTDYVLDGRKQGLKSETAHCRPINTYAESKREGELQVQEALTEALILRVSWVCGNPEQPSFVESVLARALRGESLAAVADKWSLPTHAVDIARAALALLPTEQRGVLHVCSAGDPLSWHDCAVICMQLAHESGYLASMVHVAEQHLKGVPFFRAKRPVHTAMDSARLRALGIRMPEATETLRHAVSDFFLFKGAVKR